MALLDGVKAAVSGQPAPVPVPPTVRGRLLRGRERTDQGANRRRLNYEFLRGNHYCYLNERGSLVQLPTITYIGGGGKPRARVRSTRNQIRPIIESKVSGATKAIPAYQVNPSTVGDSRRVQAADLATKVLLYGYTKWNVRRSAIDTVTNALVAEAGFAWPYFDTSVGPFVQDSQGEVVGRGEICIRTFTRNEVDWEPGIDFEDSPWCAVRQARLIDDVKAIEGYLGGDLAPDAQADAPQTKKNRKAKDLVLVTDYLERPSKNFPQGRWLTIANGRLIAGISTDPETGLPKVRPYPLTDADGNAVDGPVLHKLAYMRDPDSDEDIALTTDLIEPQRALNNVESKIAEWTNRTMNPRILAPVGSMITQPDEEPGGIDYYRPVGGQVPQWAPTPQPPPFLQERANQIKQDMQYIGNANEIPSQLSAAASIQAFIEQQQERWQQFLANVEDWYCSLGRHCLYLVAQYYSEERLISFRGEFGWDDIQDFKGSDLLGETDVRLLPGSLTSLTREQAMQQVQMLAATFPGQMTLEQALSAIQSGDAANSLLNGFRYDVAEAEEVIKSIRGMGKGFFEKPPRTEFIPQPPTPGTPPTPPNPATGDPGSPGTPGTPGTTLPVPVPGWYPRKQANAQIQKSVIANYMKTPDFKNQPQAVQEGLSIYYDALELIEQQGIQGAAQAQEAMASTYGMQNAAAPQVQPAQPSPPSLQPAPRPA